MGKLRRPDLVPGALDRLVEELHALHARAGFPSVREIAKETDKKQQVSYTAVHDLFTKTTTEAPKLPVLHRVVDVLAKLAPRSNPDDVSDKFDELWRAAHESPFDAPTDRPRAAPREGAACRADPTGDGSGDPESGNSFGDEAPGDSAAISRESEWTLVVSPFMRMTSALFRVKAILKATAGLLVPPMGEIPDDLLALAYKLRGRRAISESTENHLEVLEVWYVAAKKRQLEITSQEASEFRSSSAEVVRAINSDIHRTH